MVGEGVLAQVHFLALLDELPILAVAVNTTSEEEFRPVSQESWITPMMKPMPTTCMATSLLMPNSAQHMGMSRSDPPATPDCAAGRTRRPARTG